MKFGEPVYRCRHCCDSGFVSVVRPETMARAHRGDELTPADIRVCSVACHCPAGTDKANPPQVTGGKQFRSLPTYRESCMVRVDGIPNVETVALLEQHMESLFDSLRVAEFDEWNRDETGAV